MPDPAQGNEDEVTTPRPRIQSLSDLIFGLALSIGAISLLAAKPANAADFLGSIGLFGFSFLILGLVWLRYTTVMSVLPSTTGTLIAFNMALLFLVSIEPYIFSLIGFQTVTGLVDVGTVTSAYAVDLGLINVIMAYFINLLTVEEKRLVPARLLRSYRFQRNVTIFVAAVFFLSALPVFTIEEKLLLWLFTLASFAARKAVEARLAR